ncbi:hypothetical protein SPBR_08544 [Sporothrix brasiliensis 5110]|uniref:Meiotic recombination protein DMC1 n=1 Tax=Sporothrix brasiliensis 5110 TaxID=1398154 RepID=A0A0C2IIR1_9PEZI|nr:uncharacterized protein SPBR_08544 [Sporothrix brasiliensis 5110]KIH86885.1 hypothetical protein SPBR_08544 [Sporothrix brasiliensis 5110]
MADPARTPASSVVSPSPGGFVPDSSGLMSPTPSHASSARSSTSALGLPHPRSHPLRPGSSKEEIVRRFVSDRLLHISRRFVKRSGIVEAVSGDDVDDDGDDIDNNLDNNNGGSSHHDTAGYASMGELCRDLDALLNNLWRSGTPSLQVQYLLSIASELIAWMEGFPPSPRATLALLRKLDYCFASLLVGEDLETRETLPGFEGGSTNSYRRVGLSRTDMVRCRSIAEQTRMVVVDVFRRGPPDPLDEMNANNTNPLRSGRSRAAQEPGQRRREDREGTVGTEASSTVQGEETDAERETTAEPTDDDATTLADEGDDDDASDDDVSDVQMSVARVYEFTLVKLGQALGDQPARIGDFEPPGDRMVLEDENDDEY